MGRRNPSVKASSTSRDVTSFFRIPAVFVCCSVSVKLIPILIDLNNIGDNSSSARGPKEAGVVACCSDGSRPQRFSRPQITLHLAFYFLARSGLGKEDRRFYCRVRSSITMSLCLRRMLLLALLLISSSNFQIDKAASLPLRPTPDQVGHAGLDARLSPAAHLPALQRPPQRYLQQSLLRRSTDKCCPVPGCRCCLWGFLGCSCCFPPPCCLVPAASALRSEL